jgi:hypothetical protein
MLLREVSMSDKPLKMDPKNLEQRRQSRRDKEYLRLLEQLEFAVKTKHDPSVTTALQELQKFRGTIV